MSMEKAYIQVQDSGHPANADPIKVLFNPTQYSLDKGIALARQGTQSLDAPIPQFVGGQGRTLTMELFFDTYEAREDVRTRYTDRIYGLLDIASGQHRPPICVFTWGKFSFRCMLERVGGRFTLFLEDGTPVRATLGVTLREYIDAQQQVQQTSAQSADHTKTYLVRRGDTLSSIAAAEYNDPARWRPIALANRLNDPLAIVPGQRLVIPAIT